MKWNTIYNLSKIKEHERARVEFEISHPEDVDNISYVGSLNGGYGIYLEHHMGREFYFIYNDTAKKQNETPEEFNDRCIAAYKFDINDDNLMIINMFVEDKFRGRGISKMLFNKLLDDGYVIVSDYRLSLAGENVFKSFLSSGYLYMYDYRNTSNIVKCDTSNFLTPERNINWLWLLTKK